MTRRPVSLRSRVSLLFLPALLAGVASAQIPMDPTAESGLGPNPLLGYPWRSRGANAVAVGQATDASLAGVSDPVVLPGPELPTGCTAREAIVMWTFHVEEGNNPPTTDVIQVNGTNVTGSLVGFAKPGLGTKSLTLTYFRRFTESGTGPVLVSTPGTPVTNSFAGVTNKAIGADPAAVGAGLSVVLVYGNCTGLQTRVLNVYAGMATTRSGPKNRKTVSQLDFKTSAGIPNLFQGGELHLFANAIDGELGDLDEFKVGLNPVGGLLAGTFAAGDAWVGQLCPASQQPCVDYLYDHVDTDVRSFVQLNSAQVTLRCEENTSSPTPDDVGQSIAAVSFYVIDQAAACGVNNGNGVNPLDLTVTNPAQIGGTFAATTAAPAGLFFAQGALPTPIAASGIFSGEFICDIGSPLTPNVPVGTSFNVAIPLDASLTGTPFCVQAAEFVGPGQFQLTNAYDCTLGS